MSGRRSARAVMTSPTFIATGPTRTPVSSAAARKATALTDAMTTRADKRLTADPPDDARDELDEVDDPRPPAGRDVVVEREHPVLLDRGDVAPARPARDRLGALVTALRVGQDDEPRVGGDDV